jgi:tellurite resistance protein TehA-like permease
MAPSLWIPLAPAGIIGVATLRLLQAGQAAGVPGVDGASAGLAVAAMGIGFGLWWAAFAALELHRMRQAGGPPVHPGWWGFVFPIGAMTLSISVVGAASGVRAVQVVGLLATLFLALVWGYVAVATARLLPHRPRTTPAAAVGAP